MQLPLDLPEELKKYENFETEDQLVEELKKHPREIMTFFLSASEDETWVESHQFVIKELLEWLTDAYINRNFPKDFFKQAVAALQKHIQILKPYIPLDLLIKADQSEYFINSLLLGYLSEYFSRRIRNECRGMKRRMLEVSEIPYQWLFLFDEYLLTGEIQDLWKIKPDELWLIIESAMLTGFSPIVEFCELVLRRYIERSNVYEMLVKAHQKSLQLLQNACIEFINEVSMGTRLLITPVKDLSLEFLSYKERAFDEFEKIADHLTCLVFSADLAASPYFKDTVKRCPKLRSLNFNDSKVFSDFFEEIPEGVKEIRLSNCNWLNHSTIGIFCLSCPELNLLDLSSNEHLNYAFWPELQKFKKLTALDVSRCYQIGDQELKMILQACPKLLDLKLMDCKKITDEGFFEIGKLSPNLARLDLSRTLITDAVLIDLMTKCTNLYSLDLSRCYQLTARAITEGIRNCPGLKKIYLNHTSLNEEEKKRIQENYSYLAILGT